MAKKALKMSGKMKIIECDQYKQCLECGNILPDNSEEAYCNECIQALEDTEEE